MSDSTLVERDGGLVVITFNRPHKKNALTGRNWDDLEAILTEIEGNPADRAVVFAGAEGNFSSGADLAGGLSSGPPKDGDAPPPDTLRPPRGSQAILHEMRSVGRILERIQRLPKPTIAAVDGVAIGVAMGVALACDLILATDRVRFSESFVKLGLGLDGGASWTLPRAVGLRRAKQICFFGDMIDAATAERWGLVNEVVAPEDLDATARAWGQRLAVGPTTAISLMKSSLESSVGSSFAEALENEARVQQLVFHTNDMAEGMQSFMERRPPEFTGT